MHVLWVFLAIWRVGGTRGGMGSKPCALPGISESPRPPLPCTLMEIITLCGSPPGPVPKIRMKHTASLSAFAPGSAQPLRQPFPSEAGGELHEPESNSRLPQQEVLFPTYFLKFQPSHFILIVRVRWSILSQDLT